MSDDGVDIEVTEDEPWTYVGEDMRIEGAVTTGSALSIRGEVVGDVTSARDIEVAEDGIIRGSVRAHEIVVAGTIDGPVSTSGRLLILASGSVNGDVAVKSILVEEGGALTGRCQMN